MSAAQSIEPLLFIALQMPSRASRTAILFFIHKQVLRKRDALPANAE
jgi:hypothetical protein